ncbi:hydroxypyruvate isomerase family protein [Paracoccus luteus]|uniref:hydroxypyruvate isomerase family protein n=1 Tax=Paracoccus luteus TaxID=2508543 RepID=UPI0010705AAD|nr:TIM barrel protein [Paracoccus luteus]
MTRFSANLGFLWADRPLPGAIRAAAAAGFDAVECHWPHDTPPDAIAAALADTGLAMLGMNTRRGRPGENGLSALPGREAEARAEIDATIAYARAIGAGAIHVMAGVADGPAADAAFRASLAHACDSAPELTVLIEPLNPRDAPGCFLRGSDQAAALIGALGRPNLKLMFDCYHLQIVDGDITRRLRDMAGIIGHVQVAAVPDRGAPDHGELDYRHICAVLDDIGWTRPVGAEYRPPGDTDASLGWMATLGR